MNASEEVPITSDATTQDRAEFTEQMEKRFVSLGREFQEMELEQLRKGELDARKKLEKAKKWVNRTRGEFENQLGRARKVSDEAWDDVSDSLRDAWTEMKEAVDRARREFAGEDTTAEKKEAEAAAN